MTASRGKRRGLLALCLLGLLLFGGLGVWQVDRLAWKRDLIARVEARIHASPVSLPPRSAWPALDLHDAEYRRVQARGHFLHGHETLVDALTALGEGYWVLTPLQTGDGVVLVNRGFVPREQRLPATRRAGQVQGEVTVTGLLRRPEPEGRVLRANVPAEDRWYSRDVAAIAAARGDGGPRGQRGVGGGGRPAIGVQHHFDRPRQQVLCPRQGGAVPLLQHQAGHRGGCGITRPGRRRAEKERDGQHPRCCPRDDRCMRQRGGVSADRHRRIMAEPVQRSAATGFIALSA